MSGERLAEIKARAEKATAGPWEYAGDVLAGVLAAGYNTIAECNSSNWDGGEYSYPAAPQEAADAEFIAHARDDVPWLLSVVKSLGDQNQELLEDADRTEAELAQARRALAAAARVEA